MIDLSYIAYLQIETLKTQKAIKRYAKAFMKLRKATVKVRSKNGEQ